MQWMQLNVYAAYQTYIDLITNQSKAVSSSFFQVYSPLSEAPDPYPLLEASVESLIVADETLPRLENESKQLQSSNAKLSKQVEEAELQLQQERKNRQSLEEVQDTRIKEVEATWSAVLTEKEDNWASREKNWEEKLENQERLLKELKASYEVSQRLDRDDGVGNRSSTGGFSVAELEIMTSDLERANARLADVESRNEQLRLELAQVATSKGTRDSSQVVQDDPEFLKLRSENSSLLRRADATRLERAADKREQETIMRSLKNEIGSLKADGMSLRLKVNKWSDYDEMKKELEILKSIEFATGDVDEQSESNDQTVEGSVSLAATPKPDGHNLEQLLMARNKKLNNELTILRVSHQDLASRIETLQDDLSSTNMELERSRNLNATLENDLTRVQNEVADIQPPTSVTGTYSSRFLTGSTRRGRRPSPTSSIISGMDLSQTPSGTLESLRAGESIGSGSGILPMITAQRDRFKKRIADLENEVSKSYQSVSALRAEVSSLQKDNLNLYEKTRYVSTYNRSNPAVSASAYASNPQLSPISATDSGLSPMDRYRSAYESKISPFAAFRGRESARALKRMSLPERIIFQITKLVLSTRTSRNFFAIYLTALHLMVFSMLWWDASTNIDSHVLRMSDNAAILPGSTGAGADTWQQDVPGVTR